MIAAESLPVDVACRVLDVSVSGYYEWRNRSPSPRSLRHAWLTELIMRLHVESRGVYGIRRVHAELTLGHGISVGREAVGRLMRRAGLQGITGRPRYRRVPNVATAEDRVRRQFDRDGRDQLWVTDIERHEAHLNPAVMKGHRLRLVAASRKKQRAARVGGRRRRWKAALSTTEQTSTVRGSGSGKQDGKAYVRNQRPNTPQEIHQPKPDGWGLGSSAHLHRELALQATPRPIDVVGQEATAKFCGVVVAMLQGYSWAPTPSKGSSVNVGTISPVLQPASVLGGRKARRRSVPARWGGGPVVVRDRESRLHGEGVQRDRSIFAKRGGRW